MKTGKGQVSINLVHVARAQPTEDDMVAGDWEQSDYYAIEVQDGKSGVEFLSLRLSLEDFARTLSGQHVDCEFELRPENVGRICETRIVHVFVPDNWTNTEGRRERAKQCVDVFNADGWVGRVSDAMNHHHLIERRNNGSVYAVMYTRFVNEE